jgi:peroxiredoxin
MSPAGRGRRRLLIGFGLLGAGLAAAAVALTVAGTLGSSAKLGADRPAAPAATFRTIDGRDVTLAGLRGQPVALYFMASWCGTCVPEAQAWGQIARDGSVQGLQVFVVDVDPVDSAQALAGFRDRYVGDGLHWVFDADQALTRAFGVASLDTTVLIDTTGRVAYRNTVPLSVAQLRQAIAGL